MIKRVVAGMTRWSFSSAHGLVNVKRPVLPVGFEKDHLRLGNVLSAIAVVPNRPHPLPAEVRGNRVRPRHEHVNVTVAAFNDRPVDMGRHREDNYDFPLPPFQLPTFVATFGLPS